MITIEQKALDIDIQRRISSTNPAASGFTGSFVQLSPRDIRFARSAEIIETKLSSVKFLELSADKADSMPYCFLEVSYDRNFSPQKTWRVFVRRGGGNDATGFGYSTTVNRFLHIDGNFKCVRVWVENTNPTADNASKFWDFIFHGRK